MIENIATMAHVAELLGTSESYIRKVKQRNPDTFPKPITAPGMPGHYYRIGELVEYIHAYRNRKAA